MKKFLITGLSVLFVALALFSCGSEEPKPEPPRDIEPLEVMFNGKVIKNGAVGTSTALTPPAGEGLPYEFVNHVVFKAAKAEQLGDYKIRIKKVGGEDVLGELSMFCLVGGSCYGIENNEITKSFKMESLTIAPDYKFNYSVGTEKPTKAGEAKLSVELLRADKVIHSFMVKMTYKP